jgi:hypothetical protein
VSGSDKVDGSTVLRGGVDSDGGFSTGRETERWTGAGSDTSSGSSSKIGSMVGSRVEARVGRGGDSAVGSVAGTCVDAHVGAREGSRLGCRVLMGSSARNIRSVGEREGAALRCTIGGASPTAGTSAGGVSGLRVSTLGRGVCTSGIGSMGTVG